jgi:hypothetical protein
MPRYVGMSKQVHARYGQHLLLSHNIQKTKWIAGLASVNLVPALWVLETVSTEQEARQREKYWIGFYLRAGYELTNKEARKGEKTYPQFKDNGLNKYRKMLGWSITKLSQSANIAYPTVHRALAGASISGRTATALANAISRELGQNIRYQEIEGLNVKL